MSSTRHALLSTTISSSMCDRRARSVLKDSVVCIVAIKTLTRDVGEGDRGL